MDILDDMGVSKLSAKVFLKVNYSFKINNRHKFSRFICLHLRCHWLKQRLYFFSHYVSLLQLGNKDFNCMPTLTKTSNNFFNCM